MNKIFKTVLFILSILIIGYFSIALIYSKSSNLKNSQKIEEKNNYLNSNVNILSSNEYSVIKSKDRVLTLELDGRKTKVYKDERNDLYDKPKDPLTGWDDIVEYNKVYKFSDFYEDINSYLIRVELYEAGYYLLVNKTTGEDVIVPGKIIISSKKDRFISSNSDVVSGFSENGFEIFKLENNHFIKEMELYPENWGPAYVIWSGVDEVTVYKEIYSDSSDSMSMTKPAGTVKYKLNNNVWTEEK
jgi:hypothetical protein